MSADGLLPREPAIAAEDKIESALAACLAPHGPIAGPLHAALDSIAIQDLLLEMQERLEVDPYVTGGPALEDLASTGALVRFFLNCRAAVALPPAGGAGAGGHDAVAVVPLRAGLRPPLFVPTTIDGLPIHARELANLLDDGWPLMSFLWRGESEIARYPTSLEALAGLYVEIVQRIYPEGPCFLAGVSFSGTLAFEMAIQLKRAGRRIAFLAIIEDNADLFERHFGVERDESAWLGPTRSLRSASLALNRRYVRTPYEGRIAFFRQVASNRRARSDADQGWADLAAGGLDRHVILGNHATMFEAAHAPYLRELFAGALATAAERNGAPDAVNRERTRAAEASAPGRRLARQGDLRGEVEQYRAAARGIAEPPYWFHEIRGHAEAEAGNLAAAAEAFAAAARADAFPAGNLVSLAAVLEFQGRIGDAIRATRRAFAWNPDDPGIPTRLGNLLMRTGKTREARAAFGAALSIRPGYPSAEEGMIRAESELRQGG